MFLLLVLTVIALFVWQRNGNPGDAETKVIPVSANASPARPVSSHNWAKNSLDRAHEVADQVRKSREQE